MQGSADGGTSPKQLLQARHLRPRKRFGQNFLTDPHVAERIAAAITPESYVLEVGGGTGALTAALIERVVSVTTIEIDRDLCTLLDERFAPAGDRLRVVSGDVLTFDIEADLRAHAAPRAIAGNLPYYITTPILERILGAEDLWETAILMVQREYARRLLAQPGTADYGSLSVFAALFARAEKLFEVGAGGFYPTPEVSSTVIRLTPIRGGRHRDKGLLLWLIRAAFAHRRKTFVNSVLTALRGAEQPTRKDLESALTRNGLDSSVRAERLALAEFERVADTLEAQGLMEKQWTTRSTR